MAHNGYIPDPSNNPYIDTGASANANPYSASGQQTTTQNPATQADSSRQPVPSPPQQNPYIPENHLAGTVSKGSTTVQPALKRARTGASHSASTQTPRYAASPMPRNNTEEPQYRENDNYRPAPRPHKPAKHWFLSIFLWLFMLGVLGLMAIRMLPLDYSTMHYVPELASFVPLALIPTVLCLVLALLWRRRLLVLVCLAALMVNGYWHAGYFFGTNKVSNAASTAVMTNADTSDAYARIMTVNTLNGYASSADIVRICREQNVEVLCLQEMTDSMVEDLKKAGIDEVLPYSVISEAASTISNGGRNAIYTAAPISNVSRNLLPIDTSSMPAVDIQVGDQTVRIVCVHPNSPVRGAEDLWDEGLSVIGSLSEYNHSYLIMGDFNSTWDHVRFRELLGSSFVDASEQSGEGFHMTYPSSSLIPSLIEIDHIVYSRNSDIVVSSLETVSIGGTDHKALLGTLEVL